MSADERLALAASGAALLVLGAAFLSWGEVRAGTVEVRAAPDVVLRTPVVLELGGWNGWLDVGGLRLPNGLVPLAAGLVALLAWLRALGVARPPRALLALLAAHGLAHAVAAWAVVAAADEGRGGAGTRVAAVALAGVLLTLARAGRRAGRPRPSAAPPLSRTTHGRGAERGPRA